jgi:hypothetical protein
MAIKPKSAEDEGEYGYEGDMAMSQLRSIIRNSQAILDKLEPDTDLPEWVQSKITLAEDYISTASNYLHSELEEGTSSAMKMGVSRGVKLEKPIQRIPTVNKGGRGVHHTVIQKEQVIREAGVPETAGVTDTVEPMPSKAKRTVRKLVDAKKSVNKINTEPSLETKGNDGSNSPIEGGDSGHNEFADKKVN